MSYTVLSCMQQCTCWVCSEMSFLFPHLLLFSEHAQYPGRSLKGGRVKTEGGGLCFQGDGNTRLYTAAAALCNRTVTMTMFKGKGWRKKGKKLTMLKGHIYWESAAMKVFARTRNTMQWNPNVRLEGYASNIHRLTCRQGVSFDAWSSGTEELGGFCIRLLQCLCSTHQTYATETHLTPFNTCFMVTLWACMKDINKGH